MNHFIQIQIQPKDFESDKYGDILEDIYTNLIPKLKSLLGEEKDLIIKLFLPPISLGHFIFGLGTLSEIAIFKGPIENIFLTEKEIEILKDKWKDYYTFEYYFGEENWEIITKPVKKEA